VDKTSYRSPHRAVRQYILSRRARGWRRWSSATTSTSLLACAQWSTGPRHANCCRSRSLSRFACTVHLQVARTCSDRDLGLNPLLITVSYGGGQCARRRPCARVETCSRLLRFFLFVATLHAGRLTLVLAVLPGFASGRSGRGPALTACVPYAAR
jgi:hypothetical protein